MKRSPLNTPRGFRSPRRTPHNWKSFESPNDRGYHPAASEGCQRFFLNNDVQPRGSDFIPLNISTPVTQHEKRSGNWRSPADGQNNASPRGWYNHRGNYHGNSRLNCSNRFSAYKHHGKKFHGQNKMGFKSQRQQNISLYVDIDSMLEDPWTDLVRKLNDAKDESRDETHKNESLCNAPSTDCESTKEFESKLSRDIDLDNSQCNQDSKDMSSMNISFGDTDLCQTSNMDSLMNSKTDDIFSQDSVNKDTRNVNDEASRNVQEENNVCSNALVIDTNQKTIDQ